MIDQLISILKECFKALPDIRRDNQRYSLDSLLSLAFAMFHLKDSSLSLFRQQFSVRGVNLEKVYGVRALPGDTALREAIDGVEPELLQSCFSALIDFLEKAGVLKKRRVLSSLGGHLVVAVDGTGHYCSGKQHCEHCLVKTSRTGETQYYHQALGAVNVHPNSSEVFPIVAEAIVKQDGQTKNDCELNAAKRLLPKIREIMGKGAIITVFDALYCTGQHIAALQAQDMRFIIATKGQTFVDVQADRLKRDGQLQQVSWTEASLSKTLVYTFNYANDLILNGQHPDCRVNYFELTVTDKKTGERMYYGTFVTDILITDALAKELEQVARCRWKIENETFNTLKNQGYHLEHNYGHGKKYLATNFMLLTFLAFLVDQMAQYLDRDFKAAKNAAKTYKALWELVRGLFYFVPVTSIGAVYRFIAKQQKLNIPALE